MSRFSYDGMTVDIRCRRLILCRRISFSISTLIASMRSRLPGRRRFMSSRVTMVVIVPQLRIELKPFTL